MQSERKETKPSYIENDQAFVQSFVALLGELRDAVPRKTSLDTIRQLLITHGQREHRMELVLAQLSNNILQHQLKTKRGPIKVISLMASVYQGELLPFFSNIVDLIVRKLKENDEELHEVLSEAVGALIQFGLKEATEDIACENIRITLTKLFQLCGTGHRHTQKGASMSVVKAIQNISPFHLPMLLNDISPPLFKLLRSHNCKTQFYLLESALNVLIVYQGHPRKLEENARLLLPAILENLDHKEGHVRKMAIEVMSTISHLLPEVAAPYKEEVLEKLGQSRYDLIKAVRDISLMAITIVQRLPQCEQAVRPSELGRIENDDTIHSEIEPQNQSQSRDLSEDKTRSRSQGKSLEMHSARTSNQPSQYQNTPPKGKDNLRPTSARASPSRPKSTGGRRQLKKNSDFFDTQKQKKEIDIIVKSPTKLNTSASSSATKLKKDSANLQIFSSPDKIYKYVYSDSSSPAHRKNRNQGNSSPVSPTKSLGSKFSPYKMKNVEEVEEIEELSNRDREGEGTPGGVQKDALEEIRDNAFKSLISQLVTVNNKQSKVKKVISYFQATTQNEILQLVTKINDIESAVLNKSKNSGNSSPSNVESADAKSQASDEIKIEEPFLSEPVPQSELEPEDLLQTKIENLFKENKINMSFELCLNEGSEKHLLKLVERTESADLKSLELGTLEKLLTNLKGIVEKSDSEEGKETLPCVMKVLQKYFELTSQVTVIYEKLLQKFGDKAKIPNAPVIIENKSQEEEKEIQNIVNEFAEDLI